MDCCGGIASSALHIFLYSESDYGGFTMTVSTTVIVILRVEGLIDAIDFLPQYDLSRFFFGKQSPDKSKATFRWSGSITTDNSGPQTYIHPTLHFLVFQLCLYLIELKSFSHAP